MRLPIEFLPFSTSKRLAALSIFLIDSIIVEITDSFSPEIASHCKEQLHIMRFSDILLTNTQCSAYPAGKELLVVKHAALGDSLASHLSGNVCLHVPKNVGVLHSGEPPALNIYSVLYIMISVRETQTL